LVLRLSWRSFPFIVKAFADSFYAGEAPTQATSITVEIVRKRPDQVGFAAHPRRWFVERVLFALILSLSKEDQPKSPPLERSEGTLASARAFVYAAPVLLLVRCLGRNS